RESLRRVYQRLLAHLSYLCESCGDTSQAIDALRRVLDSDLAHEDAHAGLMRLYATIGLHHQALSQFQLLRETLRNELDVEPAQSTIELNRHIQEGTFTGEPDTTIADVSPPQSESVPTNLPALLTPLIGRERE